VTKYRRVVVSQHGGPNVLHVVEDTLPEPQPGEVRVRILAAGVSFADVLMREGIHPETMRPPFTLGWELVGVVDKQGPGVSGPTLGDRVAALSVRGSYAHYLCLPAQDLVPVPNDVDPVEAACMAFIHLTAYQMLHRTALAKAGDRVLIHSAGGPVGTALLQLGGLCGVEMYGTASKRKHDLVSSLGAIPIDYKAADFVDEIRRLTGNGVDIVFDGIGGTHILRSYKALRRGGVVVAFGHATSLIRGGQLTGGRRSRFRGLPTLAGQIIRSRVMPNGKKVVPYSIQTLKRRHPDWYREDMTSLFELLSQGKLTPIVAKRLGLEEATHAHELLSDGSVTGRIMLVMG
jgi:NADPH2:quinone reductase